jgi:long-chain acyl-CoA synthetase
MDLDTARDRAEIDRAIDGQTICTLFQATAAAHGPEPALVTKRGGTWVSTSWQKKDIIVTAGGKNVTPSNIENTLKREPLVSQVMMVGDARPYCAALITLDEAAALGWARGRGVTVGGYAELLADRALHELVQSAVDRVNAEVARVEQIKRFTILAEDWSAGSDELTPTLKVRRRAVHDKYRALIDAMYAAPPGSDASSAA